MAISPRALSNNHRTIQSYEGYAQDYDRLISPLPSPDTEAALRRIADVVGPGGTVLEIGSGPGRDADFLESLGAVVRRTDATQAFLDLQAARDKRGELLNVLTDDLGGPYDAVLALCVLIHIDRDATDAVLGKIAAALRPDGAFLVSLRDGAGETSGDYHTIYWRRDDFAARLTAAGLRVEWDGRNVGREDEAWLTFLARKGR